MKKDDLLHHHFHRGLPLYPNFARSWGLFHFQHLDDGIDLVGVEAEVLRIFPLAAAFIINGSRSEGDFPAPCRAICWSMSSLFLSIPASFGLSCQFSSKNHTFLEYKNPGRQLIGCLIRFLTAAMKIFFCFTVVLLRNYLLEMVHSSP